MMPIPGLKRVMMGARSGLLFKRQAYLTLHRKNFWAMAVVPYN